MPITNFRDRSPITPPERNKKITSTLRENCAWFLGRDEKGSKMDVDGRRQHQPLMVDVNQDKCSGSKSMVNIYFMTNCMVKNIATNNTE